MLRLARPLMREIAEELSINVGLAVADAGEMIYLDLLPAETGSACCVAPPGVGVAIAETALGRAWIAAVNPQTRGDAFEAFAGRTERAGRP